MVTASCGQWQRRPKGKDLRQVVEVKWQAKKQNHGSTHQAQEAALAPAFPFLTSNNGWHKRALILMQRTATTLPNDDEGATGQVAAATAASGCALQRCPSLSHNLEAALLTWPPPFALRTFQYASSGFKALAQLLCLPPPSFVSSECSLPMHVVCSPPICPSLGHASHVTL